MDVFSKISEGFWGIVVLIVVGLLYLLIKGGKPAVTAFMIIIIVYAYVFLDFNDTDKAQCAHNHAVNISLKKQWN